MVAAGSRRAKGSRLIIDVETSMIAAEAMGDVETLPYRWVTEEGVSTPSLEQDGVEDVQTSSSAEKRVGGVSAPSTSFTRSVSKGGAEAPSSASRHLDANDGGEGSFSPKDRGAE